jgi:hypothetical protein
LQLRLDRLRQLFPQLHSPLVERVDVPDDTLREDFVFVERCKTLISARSSEPNPPTYQNPQSKRRNPLDDDAVGGPVPLEDLVGQDLLERLPLQALLLQFLPGLVGALAGHERLGLGQEIGQQYFMVQSVIDGVEGLGRGYEIGGDDSGPLVDQLVEGVLAVGPGLAPHDGAGGVVHLESQSERRTVRDFTHPGPAARDVLAVALHVALLEVGGEAVQVLVVGQQGVGLGAVEVVVPDTQKGEDHGSLEQIPSVLLLPG